MASETGTSDQIGGPKRLPGPGTVNVYPTQHGNGWAWSCSCGTRGHGSTETQARDFGLAHQLSHENYEEIRARVDARNAENHHHALVTALAFGRERLYQTNAHFKAAIDQMVPMTQILVDGVAERAIKQAEHIAAQIEAIEKGET